MDNLPVELNAAVLCSRIAGQMYEGKPWFIELSKNGVYVTEEFFHETFNTWYVEAAYNVNSDYHIHKVDGVKVYCLVSRGDTDV